MYRLYFLLPILFCCLGLTAQLDLRGTLTDAVTGEPIGFATVYLSGTSIGDVTGDDGTFSLKVPAGREQSVMVVSHLNYQTINVELTAAAANLELILSPKAANLTQIEVEGADRREENLAEFKKAFIGNDEWGKRVLIHNDEVIRFYRDIKQQTLRGITKSSRALLEKRNLRDPEWSADGSSVTYSVPSNLKAVTDGPLQVTLADLGYELHIDLSSFRNDYQSRQMSYLGSNYFIPLRGGSDKQQQKHERNRMKAYYGSSMHFIRSLLSDSIAENGFQVVEVLREPSATRQQEIKQVNLRDHLRQNEDGTYRLFGLSDNQYAVLYHGDRIAPGADPILRASSNVLESRMFLVGETALILPSGTLGDTNLVFSGDIGDRKLAWTLPDDYYPPVKTKKVNKKESRAKKI